MRALERADKDFGWLVKHSIELQRQYAGKWIAVVNEEVAGVGDSAPEAYNKARKKYPNVKPLLEAVPTGEALIL